MWINLSPDQLEVIRAHLGGGPVDAHKARVVLRFINEWEERLRSPLYKHFHEVAFERHHEDGKCEIDRESDETCMVSISSEGGAYVMGWLWVSDEDAGVCRECGDFPGSETYGTEGDGYDGLCPKCADEAHGEEEDEEEMTA